MVRKARIDPTVRRQQLIDAAHGLFLEKGYEDVSVRDILKIVGGHPGLFYYYFSSKQEILFAVMEQLIERETDESLQRLQETKNPYEKLCVLSHIINLHIAHMGRGVSTVDAGLYSMILRRITERLVLPMIGIILEARERELIILDNPDAVTECARFLIHGCYGLIYEHNRNSPGNNEINIVPYVLHYLRWKY